MIIKLREDVSTDTKNEILKQMNFDVLREFWNESDNELWLKDINENPESHQRHWKPEDRDLTMEELLKYAGSWADTQQLSTDLYFGRTSDKDMQLYSEFIVAHKDDIEYITDVDLLIERGEIKEEYHSILKSLEKEEKEPEMYPVEERITTIEERGHLLCKSWSNSKFWVTFGRVDNPRFMKEKVYKDDLYNNILRDANGVAHMLIPLNDFSPDFEKRVYEEAWQLGLREHPNFFLPYVYKYEMSSPKEVGKDFAEFYTAEELTERLMLVLKDFIPEIQILEPNQPLMITGHGMFKWSWKPNLTLVQSKLQLLNALTFALKSHYGTLYEFDIKKSELWFKKKRIVVE